MFKVFPGQQYKDLRGEGQFDVAQSLSLHSPWISPLDTGSRTRDAEEKNTFLFVHIPSAVSSDRFSVLVTSSKTPRRMTFKEGFLTTTWWTLRGIRQHAWRWNPAGLYSMRDGGIYTERFPENGSNSTEAVSLCPFLPTRNGKGCLLEPHHVSGEEAVLVPKQFRQSVCPFGLCFGKGEELNEN